MSNKLSDIDLPKGWTKTTVGGLSLSSNYGFTASSTGRDTGVKFLRITDIQEYKVNWQKVPFCEINEDEIRKYSLEEGDIVFARTGATVGKSFLIQDGIPKAVFASYLIRLKLSKRVNPKYLFYFFQSGDYWQQIGLKAAGIGQPNVNASSLSKVVLPICSEYQQTEIVNKLDELFSELDQCIKVLRSSQSQLITYKQALLKSAFEGILTKKWREDNKPEPAEKLFVHISELRESRYEKKLELWNSEMRIWKDEGKNDRQPKKPKPRKVQLGNEEKLEIASLPIEWIWIKFGDFEDFIGSGSTPKGGKKVYLKKGIPFVRSMNVYPNKLLFENLVYIDEATHARMERTQLKERDVLLNITGASIGRSANVPFGFKEGNVNQHVCIIRPFTDLIDNEYLCHYLNSPIAQSIIQELNSGATREAITLEQVRSFPFPLASLEEQKKIVEELESKFSIIENLDKTIETSIQKSETLRQSILKEAFQGRLVKDDLQSEPAEVLLKLIKEEQKTFIKQEKERINTSKSLSKERKLMAKSLKSIIEILKESKKPVLAKTLWEESIHRDDIDEFYAALKTHIEAGEIVELPRQGKESSLKLA